MSTLLCNPVSDMFVRFWKLNKISRWSGWNFYLEELDKMNDLKARVEALGLLQKLCYLVKCNAKNILLW